LHTAAEQGGAPLTVGKRRTLTTVQEFAVGTRIRLH